MKYLKKNCLCVSYFFALVSSQVLDGRETASLFHPSGDVFAMTRDEEEAISQRHFIIDLTLASISKPVCRM